MLHIACASAAADTPLCAVQLIFIGPLGRSYSPQGANVSPALVRCLSTPMCHDIHDSLGFWPTP
jgi:hypothetical protein